MITLLIAEHTEYALMMMMINILIVGMGDVNFWKKLTKFALKNFRRRKNLIDVKSFTEHVTSV